mgnify:CR=1 FL=1
MKYWYVRVWVFSVLCVLSSLVLSCFIGILKSNLRPLPDYCIALPPPPTAPKNLKTTGTVLVVCTGFFQLEEEASLKKSGRVNPGKMMWPFNKFKSFEIELYDIV